MAWSAFSQTYADEPFKRASMRLLTREVNACIEGIHAATRRLISTLSTDTAGEALWPKSATLGLATPHGE